MKEIEILIEVKDSKNKALETLSKFTAHGIKRTLDIYFYDPLRKDLQPDGNGRLLNCFRLREKDGKSSIAYKIDYFEKGEWIYSDEHETEIGNFETALRIINHLRLEELVRIDNEKHTFTTSDYEIVLEDVRDLGLFMEVEKLDEVSDDKIAEAKEDIREFLSQLGITFGKEQNAGKPELMLKKVGML